MSDDAQHEISPPPKGRHNFFKALALSLVIFLCGGVFGSGLTLVVAARVVSDRMQHPEETPRWVLRFIDRRLGLDDDQYSKVKAIVLQHHAVINNVIKELHPKVREEMDKMRDEIAGVLTEEQAKTWAMVFERFRKHLAPRETGIQSVNEKAAAQ